MPTLAIYCKIKRALIDVSQAVWWHVKSTHPKQRIPNMAIKFFPVTGEENPFKNIRSFGTLGFKPIFFDAAPSGQPCLKVDARDANRGFRTYSYEPNGLNGFYSEYDTFYDYYGVYSPPSTVQADVDDDGDLDQVTGNADGTLSYLENLGGNNFVSRVGSDNPFDGIDVGDGAVPTFGDVNIDGRLDLLVGSADGGLHYFRQNNHPVAVDDEFTTNEHDAVADDLLGANPTTADSDSDGGALTVTEVNGVAADVDSEIPLGQGTLQVMANGEFMFNPDGGYEGLAQGESITETFTYTIDDGYGASATATVTITIEGVNDAPVAVDDTFTITEDFSILDDVLAPSAGTADSDADNELLTITEVNGLAADVGRPIPLGNGQLLVQSDGSFLFDPDHGYESMGEGEEDLVSFTYTIDDGQGASASATVTITIQGVNDAPVTRNDHAVTAAGVSVEVPVLANDYDIEAEPLTVSDVFNGSGGTASIVRDGQAVLYTPNPGFSGFDSFTYTADDGNDGTDGTVRVLVASHTGDSGNNSMFATAGVDYVLGNGGNDYIQTFGGADYIDAGEGQDTVFGGSGADTQLGGGGNDTFYATSFDLLGDSIDGGTGTDTLVLTGSTNFVVPQFSFSNLEQLSFSSALTVDQTSLLDLSSLTLTGTGRTINGGFANNQIIGSKSNDALNGGGGNDNLNGSAGNDTVQGGTGSDTINGGTGNDTLAGNTTAAADGVMDTFVFNTALNALTNVDQIVRFEASGNASSPTHFILFDTTTGNLYYDADGNGIGPRVLFASLGSTFTGVVDAGDFTSVAP